ncbi:MAG: GNAT family N-acetyltransferase [Rhodoferax sp.]|uniref:GNAT family N-acetyltransferase n=1 Tax=Rhodoferax sp. TaxID=50421 RepID=UPI002ACD860A|nr:GNAT family N-acetyltransferase [Rhodoferax sp.]MDZ7892206.1 GNAT family N-acetyltransferase [Rhodoferax sp.]
MSHQTIAQTVLTPFSVPLDPQVVLTNEVPLESRDLIWATFFESRNRGISLDVHFPWMSDASSTYCLTIYDQALSWKKTAVAALVIRVIQSAVGDSFGLIGLVCVTPKFRRLGISSKLMLGAVEVGIARHWKGLMLWTQKPDVYLGQGFFIAGRELFGSVECLSATPISAVTLSAICQKDWPTTTDIGLRRGLPPFATGAIEYSQDGSRLVVLQTQTGPTVADWDGEADVVLKIIGQVLPRKWFLNTYPDDAVMTLLASKGMEFQLTAATSRMTKLLSDQVPFRWPKVGILDRI